MKKIKRKLFQVWQNRFFIFTAIKIDFTARFSRSALGSLWAILNPLVMVAIYAFILSKIMQAKLTGIDSSYAYPIYLISGIVGWTLFTEIVSRSLTVFIENGHYLKKLSFPHSNLIFIVLGVGFINTAILTTASIAIFLMLGFPPTVSLLWLVPLGCLTALFALGIGVIFGVLNVFVRDVGQVVPIVLQLLFWLTPIVYTINIIPIDVRQVIELNPMFSVINMYHDVLAYQISPPMSSLLELLIMGLGSNFLAYVLYKKAHKEIVEES
ncbi:MAG TPA: ABC transporter permease [Gammaproteobacteria bacterium]|jgi:lipopolysaccharide transport system permease protein|nr:ABC transporter permease [Gammaproteobacteria bacterium]